MTLGDSIKRPFTNFGKLTMGLLISSIPVINFLALGYFLECYRTARTRDFELPDWKNIWNMFSEGAFAFLIILIYFTPLLIAVKLMGISYSELTNIEILKTINPLKLTLISALDLISIYMIPISLKKYALTKKIRNVFSKEVLRNALKLNYLLIWITGLSILIITTILFEFVPYIGIGIILFLTGTIFSTYYGAKND